MQYQVPEKLYQAIYEETGVDAPQWSILDLGCGTGLSGERFKHIAKKLIGLDISKEMVEIAKKKNIYDELKVADIQQAIVQYHDIDLIIAADVFTYIGDLSNIFKKARKTLTNGGVFAFSVEKTHADPYILQPSIRYAHSKKYLETLIKENGFEMLRLDNLVLRKQKQKPVEGYLIVLKSA